eukprot:g7994.t1
MSGLDYHSLDGPFLEAESHSVFRIPTLAVLGMLGFKLSEFGSNYLFSRNSNNKPQFVPMDGMGKVLTKPARHPGLLQLAPTQSGPFCLFSYGSDPSAFERDAANVGTEVKDGWIYGAKLQSGQPLGMPTGSPADVIRGRLLCWSPNEFLQQLKQADQTRRYDPSRPEQGSTRRGPVFVVERDGSATWAFWYFQTPLKAQPAVKRITHKAASPGGQAGPGNHADRSGQAAAIDFRGMNAQAILEQVADPGKLDLPAAVAAWFLLGQQVRRQERSLVDAVRNDRRCGLLKGRIVPYLDQLSPVKLSNMWLGARDLQVTDRDLLHGLQESTRRKVEMFEAQALSNTFNSIASLAQLSGQDWTSWQPSPNLLEDMSVQAADKVTTFKPQEISNTLNGIAKLGFKPTNLTVLLFFCYEAEKKATYFKPQEISNFLNAMAKLGYSPSMQVMQTLFGVALREASRFKAQEIANLLNGAARIGYHPGEEALTVFCAQARVLLYTFKPQEIASLLNALSRLGFHPGQEWLNAFSQEAALKAKAFNPQGIANLLNGMAKLAYNPGEKVLQIMCREVVLKREGFTYQNIANTLHALCVMNYVPKDVFVQLIDLLPRSARLLEEEELSQLYLVDLSLRLEHAKMGLTLPVMLRKACSALQMSRHRQTKSSKLHKAVSDILLRYVKLVHQCEDFQTGLFLDISMPEQKLAIEVDGPVHFSTKADGSRQYLGTTVLKHRLLKAMGWRMLLIPFYEWDIIPYRNREQRAEYLRNKLRGLGVALPDS